MVVQRYMVAAPFPFPSMDPVRCCALPGDAFPRLAPNQCARLIERTRTRLVYALGDETAPSFPFQHVVVGLPLHETHPTVQWYVSSLIPGTPQVVVDGRRPLRAQHFFTGRRRRVPGRERALYAVLADLHATHRGDALRAYQNGTWPGTVPPEVTDAVHVLAHHVWRDVMREYTDRLRRMVHTGHPVELLRVARRMARFYPPPSLQRRRSRCGRWWSGWWSPVQWRWWRWRLARRLRYRYPLLTPRAARALADDVTYVAQCPTGERV